MNAKEFKCGDKICLLDVSTGDKSTYSCDYGTFINYENNLVVWESKLGGIYKTPFERVVKHLLTL